MTTDEKKIVELLDVTEPIKSITLITESSEDKEIDVKLKYQIESYHITGDELFLYIKKDSTVIVEKVRRNKDIQQINMDLQNESNT